MQRDLAAFVVVTAMACACLVLQVTMLSRCVLFDCRQVSVAWHHSWTWLFVTRLCNDWCHGPDSAGHLLEVPQLLFLVQVIDFPVVAQRQIPLVLVFRRLQRFPCCSTSTWWSAFMFSRSDAEFQLSFETVEVPQNSSVALRRGFLSPRRPTFVGCRGWGRRELLPGDLAS